jgi:hypothetical protein
MHAANKAASRATLAKATPYKPPGQNAKAKKATADKRQAATGEAELAATRTKPGDGTKPPTEK